MSPSLKAMNKLFLLISMLTATSFGAPVPLDNIPGIDLPGVQLEMTREALLARYPNAVSMAATTDNVFGDSLPGGGTLLFEFKDNKLASLTVTRLKNSPERQAQQTRQWISDFRTQFGNPTKIEFGKLRRGPTSFSARKVIAYASKREVNKIYSRWVKVAWSMK
jgi:hypothetical protein